MNNGTNHSSGNALCVQFIVTSMPVGGAETLLMNLVRRMDRRRFAPEIVCLKEPGPLGEELSAEMPVYSNLIRHKYDVAVLGRLRRLMRERSVAAVVTVAAGDNMFWGRLAARLARVPVVASALHSTGWPDGVGRLNRLLTPVTDAFIAVADAHREFLVEHEGFPPRKVHTIYNGVDAERFVPRDSTAIRAELGLPLAAPIVGILAALRPEKNHELFLKGARQLLGQHADAKFLVVGDGPCRDELERQAANLDIASSVEFLGNRSDVPELLSALDVLALTSHNEASPVSILESLSCGCPVVAANVGSVNETVVDGETGFLFAPGDVSAYVTAVDQLLRDPQQRSTMGAEGRRRILARRSLAHMTRGYEVLIEKELSRRTSEIRRTVPAVSQPFASDP